MNTDIVEILPTDEHQYSVIWLHGLGASGSDFESIVSFLNIDKQSHIHFIFPNAPIQSVTINNGMEMRSWYDIYDLSLERKVDVSGIYQSSDSIVKLIEQEIAKGIGSENILLAGFSQGGVIALHTGLRYPNQLAGILGLSTYLPTLEQLNNEASKANKTIPIMMAHGSSDPIVNINTAKKVFNTLKDSNYPISWAEYPMEHAVCQEEIDDITDFINRVFNNLERKSWQLI